MHGWDVLDGQDGERGVKTWFGAADTKSNATAEGRATSSASVSIARVRRGKVDLNGSGPSRSSNDGASRVPWNRTTSAGVQVRPATPGNRRVRTPSGGS